jgi:hypothetical protein
VRAVESGADRVSESLHCFGSVGLVTQLESKREIVFSRGSFVCLGRGQCQGCAIMLHGGLRRIVVAVLIGSRRQGIRCVVVPGCQLPVAATGEFDGTQLGGPGAGQVVRIALGFEPGEECVAEVREPGRITMIVVVQLAGQQLNRGVDVFAPAQSQVAIAQEHARSTRASPDREPECRIGFPSESSMLRSGQRCIEVWRVAVPFVAVDQGVRECEIEPGPV